MWGASTVSILTTDNRMMDGQVSSKKISVRVGGQVRDLPWERILSIHNATAASAMETEQINKSIQSLQGSDRKEHDLAVEVLSNMGMIVM